MKKIKIIIFLTFMMLAFSTYRVNAVNFVPYDMLDGTGTYAETTQLIQVALEFKTDVDKVQADLTLTDGDGNLVTLDEIIALNDIGGKATRFKVELTTPLDKNGTYTLSLDESSLVLDLDNSAPLISFTNKVRNDADKYDERNQTYLIEQETRTTFEKLFKKKEEKQFELSNYIRLNVVDNRDGSLIDEVLINNLPNLYKPGDYDVTVTATDSWGNTSETVFHFKVLETDSQDNLYINIGLALGVVIIIGASGFILFKLKSR